jgi:hypothetical protein
MVDIIEDAESFRRRAVCSNIEIGAGTIMEVPRFYSQKSSSNDYLPKICGEYIETRCRSFKFIQSRHKIQKLFFEEKIRE